MMDEKKLRYCVLTLAGEDKVSIAKQLNISRQTLYNWAETAEVKQELEQMHRDIKDSATQKITGRLDLYIDELNRLALNSKDARTQAQILTYLVDKVVGKNVSRIENINSEDKDRLTVDILEDEFEAWDLLEDQKLKVIK